MIDLDLLQEEGLLEKEEYEALDWGGDPLRVDYEALYRSRFQVLRLAYEPVSYTHLDVYKRQPSPRG